MSFNNLDLSNVNPDGNPILKSGIHPVRVSEAEFKPNKSNTGNVVSVKLEGMSSAGYQTCNFNVQHSNPQAQEIAQRQFKSFLIAAGHPNPDHPGDVRSIIGLMLNIVVEENGTYTARDGSELPSFEIASRGGFQPLHQQMNQAAPAQSPAQAQHNFVQGAQTPAQPNAQYSAEPYTGQPQHGERYDGYPV